MSEKESLEQFLARGGSIAKVETPKYSQDMRSDYSSKDKIDIVMTKSESKSLGAQKMFNRFANAFVNKGNTNWKWGK